MEVCRIAGIILQKESRRGQTLRGGREGSGKRGRRGEEGEREEGVGEGGKREAGGQAGWLAGSVVALVLIHNPCRPPSCRATEVDGVKERERGRERVIEEGRMDT